VAEGEHLGVLAGLLREGPDRLRSLARRARSSWIEFEGDRELNINLDGELLRARHFRVECRPAALQVRLGPSPLFGAG
jgi:diacylglycerol kinase family enzyme